MTEVYTKEELTTFDEGTNGEDYLASLDDEPECSPNCEDPDCHLTHG